MAIDIKNLSDYSEKIRNVSHILTETLGTTTSYSFLEDTLRPYVKKNLKEYVLNHWNDAELLEIVKALKKQAELELKEGWVGGVEIPDSEDSNATKEAIVAYALNQMDGSNLASLNRLVVKDGCSKGQLKGHLFPDVIPAFKKWSEEGKKIYLYSSGMELSQQCLISNTIDGDMTELISGCFESCEFPPAKSESFRELCKKVDSPADKVAFLTHNATSACAAHKAGLVVIMLSRDGNSYIGNCTRESFPVISSFEDISKQICGKRKAPAEEENSEGKRAKLDEQVSGKQAEIKPEEKVESVSDSKPQVKASDIEVAVDKVPEVKDDSEEKMEVDDESKEAVEKTKESDVKIVVTPPKDDAAAEKVSEEVSGAPDKAEKVSVEVSGAPEEVEKVSEKVNSAPEAVKETAELKETVDKVTDVAEEAAEKGKDEEKQTIDEVKDEKKTVKEASDDAKEATVKVDALKEKSNETVEEVKEDVKDASKEVDVKEGSEKADVPTDVAEKVEDKACVNDDSKAVTEDKKVEDDGRSEVAVENVKDDSSSEAKVESTETSAEINDKAPSSEEEKPKENGVSEDKVVENGGDSGAVSDKEKAVNGNGVMHVNGKGDGAEEGDKAEKAEKETEIVAKKVETDDKAETTAEECA